jgi:hypothetical protein
MRIWCFPGALILIFSAAMAYAQPRLSGSAPAEAYRLVRIPEPGEMERFRITRMEDIIDSRGRIIGRTRSVAFFDRETLYVNPDTTWTYRYVWTSFSTGRVEGSADSVQIAEIAAARGFSYDYSTADRQSLPALPIGGMAKTPETFVFCSMMWDAVTLLHAGIPSPGYRIQDLRRVGQTIRETGRGPALFDFTPVVSNFLYTRQPFSVTLTGLTAIDGISCATLRFSAQSSPVSYVYATDRMRVQLTGAEDIAGEVALSVDGRRFMEGSMRSLLIADQTVTVPGKTLPVPVVIRQSVHLERMPDKESR